MSEGIIQKRHIERMKLECLKAANDYVIAHTAQGLHLDRFAVRDLTLTYEEHIFGATSVMDKKPEKSTTDFVAKRDLLLAAQERLMRTGIAPNTLSALDQYIDARLQAVFKIERPK